MTSSTNRRKRKGADAAGRLAKRLADKRKPAPAVSIDPHIQGAKILALEQGLEHLVEMQRVNHGELVKAFQMVDAHQWVLRKICEDIATNRLIRMAEAGVGDVPGINLQAYYELFNERQRAAQAASMSTPAPEEPEEDAEVFGGDPDRGEVVLHAHS